ncbi:MAG TPA: carboxypeptidase M32 [Stellaceae bacterium]|nr:carboxypeptidase M32 [Stellaceae bacterium]
MTPYQTLETRFRRLGTLGEATAMLGWDSATQMPEGAAPARAEQTATLRVIAHEILTQADTGDLLAGAEAQNGLDAWQRANVHEMRRRWLHATAVPPGLVEALTKACSASEMVWRRARPAADFAAVRPHLEKVLDLVREAAAAKAAKLGVSPYEALLDEYEPGGTVAAIDTLFDDLEGVLPALIEGALARQARLGPPLPLEGAFPVATQRELGVELMKRLGFDFEHGRLDISLHPFCGGTPDDVRITTRYDETNFTRALMGVLHETGHALYERGLPAAWRRQPVGEARGMSVHEGQSLLMEMQACRSREFLEFAAPLLREAFGGKGPAWEPANLYRIYTRVERGFIRVDADEVTYPAHVILRYRLERAMIAGDLEVEDLPGEWNQGMRELVGVSPPSDREGCLQDIHWYDGAWGYFPTYTLGAMTAAQLFAGAKRAVPGIPAAIARGDFAPLLGWLREHVHGKGSLLATDELLRQATDSALDARVYEDHLRRRYLD